jgi:ABC-type transporter Mla subunit MlaD
MLRKSPVIFFLGATIILSIFLGLIITQAHLFSPKKNFHTFIKKADGLYTRPGIFFKGLEIGKVTAFNLTKENKIKVDFYLLKKFIKRISKNSIIMLEENLLTGDINKLNLVTEFQSAKSSLKEINFIPWEDSPEGEKIRNSVKLDYSGNQIGLILNQISKMVSKVNKNKLSTAITDLIVNLNEILQSVNDNKIPTKVGDTLLGLTKLLKSSKQFADNYKNPKGILLTMTDPNLRKLFRTIEKSLHHLKEILEKVHENKNEIGPLLENLNIVLKEVKIISKKLNRMPIFESTKQKEELLNFEIDN